MDRFLLARRFQRGIARPWAGSRSGFRSRRTQAGTDPDRLNRHYEKIYIDTSWKSSNFGFCNESLGCILAISSEKLLSCFYGVVPKTFFVSLIYQTHVSNNLIVQFFDIFTLNMYSSMKIIAIL